MTDHQLLGIHHVTVMTDSAEHNYRFFTEALSMRLVKKTVNQDDIQTYPTSSLMMRGQLVRTRHFLIFLEILKPCMGQMQLPELVFVCPMMLL